MKILIKLIKRINSQEYCKTIKKPDRIHFNYWNLS
jgi:hypothetical protein